MQDLTINNLPTTPEEDEAMQDLTKQQAIAQHEAGKQLRELLHTRHAPEPQPSAEVLHNPPSQVNPEALIEHMVAQFSTNLRLLLTTIISQPKAQPEGANLQDCVEQVLQQAVWFEKMVEEQVESRVEEEVESYFQHGFDPSNFFDFGDAVSDCVSDQIDDIVSDKIDDVVQEQLEEVVAEKLKNIRVVFD
jgi:hypothetical protein